MRGPMLRGEEAQPLDAIAERAELVVIDDRRASRSTRDASGCLAVLVEEEARVGEPRAQHALVAVRRSPPDRAVARLLTIRKRGVSAPLASASAKYFWFCCIVRIRHSCGTARNAGSNVPA